MSSPQENALLFQEKRARGDFAKLRQPTPKEQEDEIRWRDEMETLLHRTEETFDLPLSPSGYPTVKVKRRLNEPEMRELLRLQRKMGRAEQRAQAAIKGGGEPTEKDLDEQTEAEMEIIALVTVSPGITLEWLREHRHQLGALDLATVVLDNYANTSREMAEVVQAAKFRAEAGGAGVRGPPESSRDS